MRTSSASGVSFLFFAAIWFYALQPVFCQYNIVSTLCPLHSNWWLVRATYVVDGLFLGDFFWKVVGTVRIHMSHVQLPYTVINPYVHFTLSKLCTLLNSHLSQTHPILNFPHTIKCTITPHCLTICTSLSHFCGETHLP